MIGFDHPQKTEDLIFNIKRQNLRKNKIFSKNREIDIRTLLESKQLTAKEISRKLIIRHSTALKYLNEMKELNEVLIINNGKYNENIWSLV